MLVQIFPSRELILQGKHLLLFAGVCLSHTAYYKADSSLKAGLLSSGIFSG